MKDNEPLLPPGVARCIVAESIVSTKEGEKVNTLKVEISTLYIVKLLSRGVLRQTKVDTDEMASDPFALPTYKLHFTERLTPEDRINLSRQDSIQQLIKNDILME